MKILQNTGLRWLWLSLLVIILDCCSKEWVVRNISCGEIIVLTPLINFSCVYNFGIVFGIFSNQSVWQRWLIILMSVLIILFLLKIMYYLKYCVIVDNVSYAMIVGGGFGNILDRVVRGVVIDFIDFHINDWHYPIFNVADIAIFVGVFLIIVSRWLDVNSK